MSLFLLKTTNVHPLPLVNVYIQRSRTALVTSTSSTGLLGVLHHSWETPGQAKTLTKPWDYPTSFSPARPRPQSKVSLAITLSFHKGWEEETEEEIQCRFGRFIQQAKRERLQMGLRELHSAVHRRQKSMPRAKKPYLYSEDLAAAPHPLQSINFFLANFPSAVIDMKIFSHLSSKPDFYFILRYKPWSIIEWVFPEKEFTRGKLALFVKENIGLPLQNTHL